MEISCNQCKGRFKIQDEKIPKNKNFTILCPKCKNKINVQTSQASEPEASKTIIDEVGSGTYDASQNPFDFLGEGEKTALLCEQDPAFRGKVRSALENMGYNITEPESDRDALKQMRFHVFDLVILDEVFGSENPDENNVMKHLKQLSMPIRRKIFVVLITRQFRTMDNMKAFSKSVNLVVNIKHIDETEKIIKKGLSDNTAFYCVFRNALIKTITV